MQAAYTESIDDPPRATQGASTSFMVGSVGMFSEGLHQAPARVSSGKEKRIPRGETLLNLLECRVHLRHRRGVQALAAPRGAQLLFFFFITLKPRVE